MDKIRVQPGLDPFGFAGFDRPLDLIQFHAVKGEDDAADGMAVERLDQRLDAIRLEVDRGDDLDFHPLCGGE